MLDESANQCARPRMLEHPVVTDNNRCDLHESAARRHRTRPPIRPPNHPPRRRRAPDPTSALGHVVRRRRRCPHQLVHLTIVEQGLRQRLPVFDRVGAWSWAAQVGQQYRAVHGCSPPRWAYSSVAQPEQHPRKGSRGVDPTQHVGDCPAVDGIDRLGSVQHPQDVVCSSMTGHRAGLTSLTGQVGGDHDVGQFA